MGITIDLRDPASAQARRAKAQRRVGHGARCKHCNEADAEALDLERTDVLCASCIRKREGKTEFDNHHVAGKRNSAVVIPIPVNDHRKRLSPAQYDWPTRTLQNPNRSPLRAAAAYIRGFIDTTVYLIEKLLQWIAEMLEAFDEYLERRLGVKWWLNTPLRIFAIGDPNAKR